VTAASGTGVWPVIHPRCHEGAAAARLTQKSGTTKASIIQHKHFFVAQKWPKPLRAWRAMLAAMRRIAAMGWLCEHRDGVRRRHTWRL
jgi:hypothetical protein